MTRTESDWDHDFHAVRRSDYIWPVNTHREIRGQYERVIKSVERENPTCVYSKRLKEEEWEGGKEEWEWTM